MKPQECVGCPLYEKGVGPVYPQPSSTNPPYLVVIGEAPGEVEAQTGTPFVGPSGKVLRAMLRSVGVRSSQCLITNTVWCRPPNNATPDIDTVEHCTKHFLKPLLAEHVNHDWLVVGSVASQAILNEPIKQCQGYVFPNPEGDGRIYPILHPAALLREPEQEAPTRVFLARAAQHKKSLKLPNFILNPPIYDLVDFIARARSGRLVVFDVETVSITDHSILCIGFTSHTGETVSVPWSTQVANAVAPLFSDPTVAKAGYHVRFDISVMEDNGIKVEGDWVDIVRLVQLDNIGAAEYKLERVAPLYLAIEPWKKRRQAEGLLLYNARDCYYEWAILNEILMHMAGTPRYELYKRTKDLERAVYGMERRGFLIDVPRLLLTKEHIKKELDDCTSRWDTLTGGVNPRSPKQVKDYFYSQGIKFWRDNKGNESTDARFLNLMATRDKKATDIINLLLRIRYLGKMYSTYLKALTPGEDGVLHTSIRITGAKTGRFSFAEPNLGNIPKNKDEFGLRHCFIARPGYSIVSSDWSQAETRLTAILSKEEQMLEAWLQGRDVHKLTASRLFDVDEDDVTKPQRELAKRILYGLSYGAGYRKVAEVVNIPMSDAKKFINKFRLAFPNYFLRLQEWADIALERGYLANPFGRIITFSGQRISTQARNFIPQSTVADMMNIVLCDLYKALEHKRSKLLLQIYDQVLVEAANEELEEVVELVHRCMNRQWPELGNCVIPADVSVGVSWGDVS